ncbi:MAG: haloacid dehalogenase type II [Gemmatimonadaceae bacterium]|nr:haloacid dehalogenase type II [Gemmatimonadaceae bacterium]NUO95648.1 haloacid dehalogenase type II [Gemmatimonadaceae bacterium]NUP56601.1 haloacid dehalogenase type II [Gemmatimonadaceae bacterium]NUR35722.1 haloacid dehalogenase type II [Gemmatimonadaceae bacterium]
MKKPVLVFDMNETLLDMSGLDPTFARIFGQPDGSELRKQWFTLVLELFLTAAITGQYRSFDKLTDEALQMLAAQRRRKASADDRAALKEAQGKIPAHPDVQPALARLEGAGFTLATLTNSTAKSAEKLLEFAGLRAYFDKVLSADAVQTYKPAREAYAYAAKELAAKPARIVLVAAHAWDIVGAMATGCEAAFVARPEKVLGPGSPEPKYQADDLTSLAERITADYR